MLPVIKNQSGSPVSVRKFLTGQESRQISRPITTEKAFPTFSAYIGTRISERCITTAFSDIFSVLFNLLVMQDSYVEKEYLQIYIQLKRKSRIQQKDPDYI